MTSVLLVDGPQGGKWWQISAEDKERGYLTCYTLMNPGATPPAGESKTPVFDRALGLPTPNIATGYYRPRENGDPLLWYYTPKPTPKRIF